MGIIPKLKKPLSSLTQLEKEKAVNKLRFETLELISEMGQPSDKKAVRIVSDYVSEQNRQQQYQQEKDFLQLKRLSVNKITYQRYLTSIIHRFVKEESIPKKYQLYVESNDSGIVIGIKKTNFYGAFKVCGIPLFDINACKILAVQLGNTIAKLEGYTQQTDSGIVLPDNLDKKKYGQRNN